VIKYIKFFLRCSKIYVAIFLTITLYLGWRASQIRFDFTIESLFRSGSKERADYDWFQKNFGSDDSVIYIAYKNPDVLSPAMRDYAARLTERLKKVQGVRYVFSVRDAFEFYRAYVKDERFIAQEITTNPLFRGNVISADGRTTCLWVVFDHEVESAERRGEVLAGVQAVLLEEQRSSGLRFHAAGIPVIENEYVALTKRDTLTFLPLAIAIFFLLLCFYFRNVMGMVLPLATVFMAVLWTVGLMQIFGRSISILSAIIPNLILIVGIADAIHVLSHYREVASHCPEKREAVARTLLTMIPACFLTSFTTAVGFASLATTNVHIVQEFGVITAIGILIAYLISINFLPSALDNLPPLRGGRALDNFSQQFSDRLMDGIARVSEKRRWTVFAVTGAIVLFSVVGMTRIRRESSWLQDLRKDNPVHQAHDFFQDNLTSVITIDLILRTDRPEGMNDLETLRKVERFQESIQGWKHPTRPDVRVTQVLSYVDLLKEVNRAREIRAAIDRLDPRALFLAKDPALRRLPATNAELQECLKLYRGFTKDADLVQRLTDDPFASSRISVRISHLDSKVSEEFMQEVRKEHRPYAADFRLMPTGKSWLAKQAMENVVDNMLSSLGLATAIIFASMAILFRSIKVGALSIIPNILPMVFVAGLMGWIGIPLNFSTITIFSIALGIAVDTTIHYLARLRVEVAADGDHVAAMYRALRGAGRPMIFSTILLVLGFGSILTSSFKFTFYFGVLGGAAILAALLCDLFVTPSLMVAFKPAVGRWSKLESKFKELDRRLAEMLEKRGVRAE